MAGLAILYQAMVDVPLIRPKDGQAMHATAQHSKGNVRDGQGECHDWGNERRKDAAFRGINQRERSDDKANEVGTRITHVDFGWGKL